VGVPAGGTTGQFLTKSSNLDYATGWSTLSLAGYATESWVTAGFYPLTGNPSGFLTASALTPYLTKADNLGSLTNFATARDNLQLGTLNNPTFAGLTLQGSGANVGQYTPTSLSLTHTTFGSFVISPSSGITFPDMSVQSTAFPAGSNLPTGGMTGQVLTKSSNANYDADWSTLSLAGYATEAWVTAGFYPLTGNPSGFLTSAPVTSVAGRTGAITLANTDISGLGTMSTATAADYSTTTVANGLYYPLSSNPASYLVAADISGKANSANAALTGNVTITTDSTSPALVITQDGTGDVVQFKDVTSDTTYSFINQNGKVNTIASTTSGAGFRIPLGTAPTTPLSGDLWMTSAGLFWGQAASARQAVDIQGNQDITGYKLFSNAYQTLGSSTETGTINIGTGATISGFTKAVNIGTNGEAGSTTNIAIGSTTGTSTTTLQGITNGVTQTAGDSSLKLATTDFVTTADNLKANLSGATFTGKVNFATISSSSPSINLGGQCDSAPASAANGDLWISNAVSPKITYRTGGVNYNVPILNQFNTFTGQMVIDTSSSTTAALRVTQRGSGNAIEVEDSTTPDATRFVVDQFGKVGVGTAPDATAAIRVDANGISFNGLSFNPTGTASHTGGPDTLDLLVTINGVNYRLGLRPA
jgi:hypothetical protein